MRSAAVAEAYLRDFDRLWERPQIEGGGAFDASAAALTYDGAEVSVRPVFCPGRGVELAAAIASRITQARERVLICSPVLTSGPILGALADVVAHGRAPGHGGRRPHPDARRPAPVGRARASWKPRPSVRTSQAGFGGKRTMPWGPRSRTTTCTPRSWSATTGPSVGSYNHSRAGEENAENVLRSTEAGRRRGRRDVAEFATRYALGPGDSWEARLPRPPPAPSVPF